MTTKRRMPLGTQPPIAAVEPAIVVAGVIEPKPEVEVDEAALRAEQQRSIIVQTDDDEWLERLDL